MMAMHMLQFALGVLFGGSALIAAGTIIVSWKSAAPGIKALRASMARNEQTREFRYTVRSVAVSHQPVKAEVLAFRPRPLPVLDGLRAAA